jgi:hypothetical protein
LAYCQAPTNPPGRAGTARPERIPQSPYSRRYGLPGRA